MPLAGFDHTNTDIRVFGKAEEGMLSIPHTTMRNDPPCGDDKTSSATPDDDIVKDTGAGIFWQHVGGGAELAVLPEMFNTGYGYGPDYATTAESSDGPTIQYLRERSRSWRMFLAAGFVERDLSRVASWWHTDADLGRPFEVFADMGRSRDRGFAGHRRTEESFLRALDRYREARILP